MILSEFYGYYVFSDAANLYIAPLFWLEGKPVYKGDELWSKAKGLKDYNYVVDEYDPEMKMVYSTTETKGNKEYVDNLSWTKQVKQIKSTYVEELVHDEDKFKPGDIVKVVRWFDKDQDIKNWSNGWVSNMDCLLGTVQTVTESSVNGVYFESSNFGFPSCALELVEEVE